MQAIIKLPKFLKRISGIEDDIIVKEDDVFGCLIELVKRYPDLNDKLFDGQGKLLLKWMVYLDDEPLQNTQALYRQLERNNQVIGIYPIIAGG